MGPAQRILDAAAAPTLERIRRDQRKAPSQIQPLLAYLEHHLFDPDLDANGLKKACGIRDNSMPIYFHDALDLPPYAYIEDCRLEIACRLLRDSRLKVWQIAQLVGYSTLQVFSRAFHRWSGMRPSLFRRRARQEVQETEQNGEGRTNGNHGALTLDTAQPIEVQLPLQLDDALVRKASEGGLSREEADLLAQQFAALYPDSFGQAMTAEGPKSAQITADEAWALLADRSPEARRELLMTPVKVASSELFLNLIEKGIQEGRRDGQKRLELTSLAIDCLDGLEGSVETDRHHDLAVKGWTWVASTHILRTDFAAAEQAFAKADAFLQPTCDVDIQAEYYLNRSACRLYQRRFDEALAHANSAISLLPQITSADLKVRCLVQRADLLFSEQRWEDGAPDLWKALDLVDETKDKYLKVAIFHGLATVSIELGRHQDVSKFIPAALELAQELQLNRVTSHLNWTQGMIERDRGRWESAETYFRGAKEGFLADEDQGAFQEALVTLDLAALILDQGRCKEAIGLAMETIDFFESLAVHREALLALQLVRRAVQSKELSAETMKTIRSYARQLQVASPRS